MATTIADKYFLKATEDLYCQADQSLESLQYALSYDSEHAPAHLLAGQIISEKLDDWERAEYHFNEAIAIRPDDFATCLKVAWYWFNRIDLERAQKLAEHLKKLARVKPEEVYYLETRIHESLGEYKLARKKLKKARLNIGYYTGASFLEAEDNRIKAKQKLLNPKRKKGRKKASKKRSKSDKKAGRK